MTGLLLCGSLIALDSWEITEFAPEIVQSKGESRSIEDAS